LFGVNEASVPGLIGRLGSEPRSGHATRWSLTPSEWIFDGEMDEAMRIIAMHARRKVAIMHAGHARMLPGSIDDVDAIGLKDYINKRWTADLNGSHVESGRLLLAPIHLPGHFIFATIDHDECALTVVDPHPTGVRARARTVARVVAALLAWLAAQRVALHKPAVTYTVYQADTATISTQTDSSSCGPMVCTYAFFLSMYGRLPQRSEFTGSASNAVRLCLYDMLLRGSVNTIDHASVLPLPAGAGAPVLLTKAERKAVRAAEIVAYEAAHPSVSAADAATIAAAMEGVVEADNYEADMEAIEILDSDDE